MRRAVAPVLLLLLGLGALGPRDGVAGEGGPRPGQPLWPPKGATDAQLYEKAMRIQSRMWWHLSPEGLLVEVHARDADAARLSHDAINLGDAAIWTGCYAASQVFRWRVTRDPDALAQVRHLAQGLVWLSEVAGGKGRLARSAGRPLKGARLHPEAVRSPKHRGMLFRPDVSRDQLAGVTLGWYCIGRFMDDQPDLQALAARQLSAIARRLFWDGMWLRDWNGKKTKHGELRMDVQYVPFAKNGSYAAIGLATIFAADELNPRHRQIRPMAQELDGKGWDDALSSQNTWLGAILSPSNVNMTTLSLFVLSQGLHRNARYRAAMGLRALRQRTIGWWNAGFCACFLRSGAFRDQTRQLLGEIRATLHAMPEQEVPLVPTQSWREDRIVPIQHRTLNSGWAWKEDVRRMHVPRKGARPHPRVTHTRADWLFAYWFARDAGALRPRVGPGAEPTAHRCPVDLPPWRQAGITSFGDGVRRPAGAPSSGPATPGAPGGARPAR